MQHVTFNIIGIACFAYIFVYSFVHAIERLLKTNVGKPFNCPLCLSWWFGLAYFMPQYGFEGILYASITSVLAGAIERKI